MTVVGSKSEAPEETARFSARGSSESGGFSRVLEYLVVVAESINDTKFVEAVRAVLKEGATISSPRILDRLDKLKYYITTENTLGILVPLAFDIIDERKTS